MTSEEAIDIAIKAAINEGLPRPTSLYAKLSTYPDGAEFWWVSSEQSVDDWMEFNTHVGDSLNVLINNETGQIVFNNFAAFK